MLRKLDSSRPGSKKFVDFYGCTDDLVRDFVVGHGAGGFNTEVTESTEKS